METISIMSPSGLRLIICKELADKLDLKEGTKIRDEFLYREILFTNALMKQSIEVRMELDKIVKENSL